MESILFEEAVAEYVGQPTKRRNRKKAADDNAARTLDWMSRKRPSVVVLPDGKERIYSKRLEAQHPDFTVKAYDETSGLFAGRDMGSITNRDVLKMENVLRNDKGLTEDTINTYRTYLQALCNFARNKLCVEFKLFPEIEMARSTERQFVFSQDQARGLLRFLDPLRQDLMRMALLIGRRKSNIALMRWKWVNQALTQVVIPADETKNGCADTVYLSEDAHELMRKRLEIHQRLALQYKSDRHQRGLEYVFVQEEAPHTCMPLQPNSVTNKSWKKAVRLYNQSIRISAEHKGKSVNRDLLIPEGNYMCGFHTARHTFATNLKDLGTDDLDLQMVGGWRSLNSVARYVKKTEGRQRAHLAKLDGML